MYCTPQQIIPIVKNTHFLLVTLLLCNAAAMETLPIVLDKLVRRLWMCTPYG